MGRRSGIISIMNAVARASAQQQRLAQQARRQQEREAIWAQKQELRSHNERQRQEIRDYHEEQTGRDISPHLISIRTTRERFQEIDLSRVDKRICLKNLGAQVSSRPDEAQPVKPIVEFDMADPRFVANTDMLSTLESRPNLMDLNPFEFENLVTDLFAKMGLEAKLTRSSRDGGVDCVAYDSRPVLGGRVVIQAKRYKNTVGVSAVRDLYGTMMNEGANKGILVTTSGYGPDAFDFVKDKPIELIDGGNLLYLLNQVGFQARIVIPQDV